MHTFIPHNAHKLDMKKLIPIATFWILSFNLLAQNNGSALYFDGINDYVDFSTDTQFNTGTQSFSIQMSFKVNNTSKISSTKLNMLMVKGVSGDQKNYGYGVDVREHQGKKVMYAVIASNNVIKKVYSKTEVANDNWYNVAAVFDRKSNYLKLYVNGVIEDSISISSVGSASNTWPLQIGRYYWPNKKESAHFTDGTIDNLAFWRTTLTEQQISDYASCPPKGKETNLFAYWNFESAKGTKLIDRTSNKNDGVLHGASWGNVTPPQFCNKDTCKYSDTTFVMDTIYVNDTTNHYDTTYIEETRYGQINRNALSFNGSGNYVGFKSNSQFNTDTSSFSLQLSYKPRNIASVSGTKIHMLLAKGVSNNQNNYGYTVDVRLHNGKKVFYAVLGSNNVYKRVYSKTELKDDVWYNVAAVYNRKTNLLELYVNGQLEDSISIAGLGTASNTWPFIIGKYYWPDTKLSSHYSDGILDNIAFWNKALTQKQVSDYMQCLPEASNEDLRALWNAEKGSGATLQDKATNGFNGDIYGASWTNVVAPQICRTDTCQQYLDTTFITIYDTSYVVIKRYDTTFVSVKDTLIIDAKLTGVPAPNNINRLKVYPNPAKDYLIIDNGDYTRMAGYKVELRNSLGQTVFLSSITSQQFKIDLNTLSGKGIYHMYIVDKNFALVAVRKIILQ
jgi:hypothetical protein